MQDKTRFVSQLIPLISEKYEKTISQAMQDAIWEALKPFEDDQCVKAFNWVFLHGKFFTNLLPDLMDQLQGTPADEAVMAFEEVRQLVVKYGYYDTVKFNYPASAATIEHLGGWLKISSMAYNDFHFFEKDFLKLYPTFKKRQQHPQTLIGYHDANNRAQAGKWDPRRELPNLVKTIDDQKLLQDGER